MVIKIFLNDAIDGPRSFGLDPSFSIRSVDIGLNEIKDGKGPVQKPLARVVARPPRSDLSEQAIHPADDLKSLGPVLGKFVGTFGMIQKGTGMNMIFRPRNGFGTNLLKDNSLELNMTVETLQFMTSTVLNKIPNKGFDDQPDIDLVGIPYMQTVSETLDPPRGVNFNVKKVDLHFEQGLLLRTQPTINPPSKVPTLARLGSIPHGTTINLQDTEPDATPIKGAPKISPIQILPFNVQKKPGDAIHFIPQTTFVNMNQPSDVGELRKPPDLTGLEKVVTIESLNNPNKYLIDHNSTKDILDHYTFTLRSKHDTLPGGGVTNIGFLSAGVKKQFPDGATGNANATDVTCQYWVSTVKHKVVIPKGDWSTIDPPILLPMDDKKDVPGPQFKVSVKKNITRDSQTIDVTSTQIQYSQNVRLDFGKLSWPHISVATLAPALPINIPSTHKGLVALT